MPAETIKCRECGSADVTEFKAGSYVCGHCEAILKRVAREDVIVGCAQVKPASCPHCAAGPSPSRVATVRQLGAAGRHRSRGCSRGDE